MSDIVKGYSFSGSSPNNNVTAEKLNSLVDDSEIQTSFVHNKTAITALAAADELLVYEASSSTFKKITATNAITAARGRPGATNLAITWASASTFAITADYVLMRNPSNGTLYLATAYSVTANIGLGVAVNGLDSSTEAANTWYYIYAISDGTNDRCIITASVVAPVLPTGYLYSCFLGAVFNNAASAFVLSNQTGNSVALEWPSDGATTNAQNPTTAGTEITALAPAAADTFYAASLAKNIPPNIVSRVQGVFGIVTNTAALRRVGIASTATGSLASTANTTNLQLAVLNAAQPVNAANGTTGTAVAGFMAMMNFSVPVKDSQQIKWASSGTGSIHSMRITGYTLA